MPTYPVTCITAIGVTVTGTGSPSCPSHSLSYCVAAETPAPKDATAAGSQAVTDLADVVCILEVMCACNTVAEPWLGPFRWSFETTWPSV